MIPSGFRPSACRMSVRPIWTAAIPTNECRILSNVESSGDFRIFLMSSPLVDRTLSHLKSKWTIREMQFEYVHFVTWPKSIANWQIEKHVSPLQHVSQGSRESLALRQNTCWHCIWSRWNTATSTNPTILLSVLEECGINYLFLL